MVWTSGVPEPSAEKGKVFFLRVRGLQSWPEVPRRQVLEEIGGIQQLKMFMLPRAYRDGAGDVGFCFEWTIHDAIRRQEPAAMDRLEHASRKWAPAGVESPRREGAICRIPPVAVGKQHDIAKGLLVPGGEPATLEVLRLDGLGNGGQGP